MAGWEAPEPRVKVLLVELGLELFVPRGGGPLLYVP